MRNFRILEVLSTDAIEPGPEFIIYHVDTGLWYLGNNTASPTPILTGNGPENIEIVSLDDLVLQDTNQIVIITGAFSVFAMGGHPDGKRFTIKNASGANRSVNVNEASVTIEGTDELILGDKEAVELVYYNTNYYIV
jgi:hypothetical protein